MGKRTTGNISKQGQSFYLRYVRNGNKTKLRLVNTDGTPCRDMKAAKASAARVMAKILEEDKAEQLRVLKNDLMDAEAAAKEAESIMVNQQATIDGGWNLYLQCPKRLKSCRDCRPGDEPVVNSMPYTYRSYYRRFQRWMTEHHPDVVLLSSINENMACAFLDTTGTEGTYNKYLTFFCNFYDVLSKSGKYTGENPFTEIERKIGRYNSKEPLTIGQVEKLINTASGEMRLLFMLGYFTGLRQGDCCTLRWEEIDLDKGIISRIPRKTGHRIKDPSQAKVKIGIAPDLYDALQEIDDRNGYLMPGMAELYNDGKTEYKVSARVKKLFIEAGILPQQPSCMRKIDDKWVYVKKPERTVVKYGFHSLRYSYISSCAEMGVPMAVIQKNAGHSNPAMTEHYTKISDAAAVEYASKMTLSNNTKNETDRQWLRKWVDIADAEELARVRNFICAKASMTADAEP